MTLQDYIDEINTSLIGWGSVRNPFPDEYMERLINRQRIKIAKETSLPIGVVDLALRTGAEIVPIFSLRQSNNTTSIFIEPPLKLCTGANRHQALKANIESLAAVLEKYISRYSEQWVVLEPFWA